MIRTPAFSVTEKYLNGIQNTKPEPLPVSQQWLLARSAVTLAFHFAALYGHMQYAINAQYSDIQMH